MFSNQKGNSGPHYFAFGQQCCDSSTRQFQFCVYTKSLSTTLRASDTSTGFSFFFFFKTNKKKNKVRLIVSLNFNKTTCEESEVSFNPKRRSRTFYKNNSMLLLNKAHGFALTEFICIVIKFFLRLSHLGQCYARLQRNFTPDLSMFKTACYRSLVTLFYLFTRQTYSDPKFKLELYWIAGRMPTLQVSDITNESMNRFTYVFVKNEGNIKTKGSLQ